MQLEFAADWVFEIQDLSLHLGLFRSVSTATLLLLFGMSSASYAKTRDLFRAMTYKFIVYDLVCHRAILDALHQPGETVSCAGFQATYTRPPALVVVAPAVKVVADLQK